MALKKELGLKTGAEEEKKRDGILKLLKRVRSLIP